MGSVIVSSCRCCIFVSCVHPVAVLNAAFCMTCSLLMLVEDARGSKRHSLQAVDTNGCANCVETSRFTFFGESGHADPLDGWRCSS